MAERYHIETPESIELIPRLTTSVRRAAASVEPRLFHTEYVTRCVVMRARVQIRAASDANILLLERRHCETHLIFSVFQFSFQLPK